MPNIPTPEAVFRSILDKSITEISDSDVTTIGNHKFRECASLTSASFTEVITIGSHSFREDPLLTSANFPKLTTMNDSAFYGCSSLVEASFPLLTQMGGSAHFRNCTGLTRAYFPALNSIASSNAFNGCTNLQTAVIKELGNGSYTFEGCTRLASMDYSGGRFRGFTFDNCPALTTLVLRKDTAITTLENNQVFGNTPLNSGGSGATIYIPQALYNHLGDGTSLDYKAASNWSTLNGYGTITWAKIEGSQYENYYVDGTPIPAS